MRRRRSGPMRRIRSHLCRLDRLGRSLKHLITLLDDLQALGIAFVSLAEGIDATTPAGKLQMHILGAIAEFERARIVERVRAGLARRAAQGKPLGRPRQTLLQPLHSRVLGSPIDHDPATAMAEFFRRCRHRRRHAVACRVLRVAVLARSSGLTTEERRAFLASACGDDAALRRQSISMRFVPGSPRTPSASASATPLSSESGRGPEPHPV
jgi:hypothetical protein